MPELTTIGARFGGALCGVGAALSALVWIAARAGLAPSPVTLAETLVIVTLGIAGIVNRADRPQRPALVLSALLVTFATLAVLAIEAGTWAELPSMPPLRQSDRAAWYDLSSFAGLLAILALAGANLSLATRTRTGDGFGLWLSLLALVQIGSGVLGWLVYPQPEHREVRLLIGMAPQYALPLALMAACLGFEGFRRNRELAGDVRFKSRMAKLIVAMTAMGAASLSIWIALVLAEHEDFEAQVGANAANAARLVEEHADRTLDAGFLAIERVAELVAEKGFDTVTSSRAEWERIRAFVKGVPQVSSILMTDSEGRIRLFTVGFPSSNNNVSDLDYFTYHQVGGNGYRISPPFVSRTTGRTVFTVSRALTDAGGRFIGVAAANIDPNYFGRLYEELKSGPDAFIAVLKRGGEILVRHPEGGPDQVVGQNGLNLLPGSLPNASKGIMAGVTPSDGQRRMVAYRYSGARDLVILVGTALDDVDASFQKDQIRSLVLAGAFLLLLAGFTWAALRELEREHAVRQALQELAATDPLTHLRNRRSFEAVGTHEIDRAKRFGKPLTALMLDIDHFKKVNDQYGHDIGDLVIIALADTCRSQLRQVDLIGRLGGEEFAVLLPETSGVGAMAVAEKLRAACQALEVASPKGIVRFTISIGVATLTPDGNLAGLLHDADSALYRAKNNGRNRVESASA